MQTTELVDATVLILIVMEHALGEIRNLQFLGRYRVLILIVMEHALGVRFCMRREKE